MRRSILFALRLFLLVLCLPAPLTAQGRILVDTIRSKALSGNAIGDTPNREVFVYTPPSYDRTPNRRFAVLYLLHGFTSHPREWLDGSYQGLDLQQTMDSLWRVDAGEFLVVMPNADNAMGGSFYVNSSAFGNWDDFVSQELVRYIDARYRTRPGRAARGLAGQSMGGFGALYIAQKHSDVFGSVYAMSPCCTGMVGELAPTSEVWRYLRDSTLTPLPTMAGSVRLARAMTAAFGAPYDKAGAWSRFLPVDQLTKDATGLRRSCAVVIEYGLDDAIASVPLGSRAYADALARAKIPYRLDAFAGGHTDRTRQRFEQRVLPFFAQQFSGAAPGSPCTP
ncbi:alpha/beta hydrolase-fold protein [Gemmatimonas sp.]|uniref:alpha/beta hydrolase n=1 Tax=Gemmatimonas sp. TaxID=1962908 RepID=UPI00286CCAA4|nr:alpha/beta hydrolase-fold protein [Gemmatimonas sp.]